MKTGNYREIASEVVERYLVAKERDKKSFKDHNYNAGYKDAVQMFLSVLNDKEAVEVKNFYRFSRVFDEEC